MLADKQHYRVIYVFKQHRKLHMLQEVKFDSFFAEFATSAAKFQHLHLSPWDDELNLNVKRRFPLSSEKLRDHRMF